MCVCMYVCMYIRTYVVPHTHVYCGRNAGFQPWCITFMHAYIRTYTHACIHIYIHTYKHNVAHTCVHAHTCITAHSDCSSMPSCMSQSLSDCVWYMSASIHTSRPSAAAISWLAWPVCMHVCSCVCMHACCSVTVCMFVCIVHVCMHTCYLSSHEYVAPVTQAVTRACEVMLSLLICIQFRNE
jgi:hypothetical protein